VKWFTKDLPLLESTWNRELTPEEQLDAFLADYIAGEPLLVQLAIKPMNHLSQGAWMLKTADVRLFGWFPQRDVFVGVSGKPTQLVKEHNLYPGLVREVVHYRSMLDLDAPKFVPGDNPNDVVSNFHYP